MVLISKYYLKSGEGTIEGNPLKKIGLEDEGSLNIAKIKAALSRAASTKFKREQDVIDGLRDLLLDPFELTIAELLRVPPISIDKGLFKEFQSQIAQTEIVPFQTKDEIVVKQLCRAAVKYDLQKHAISEIPEPKKIRNSVIDIALNETIFHFRHRPIKKVADDEKG